MSRVKVPHKKTSREVQILLTGCFLVLIFGLPVSQAAIEIYRGIRPRILGVLTRMPTEENLRAFEKQIEDSSFYSRLTRPWIQNFWFKALRNPGDKVVLGRDGWLFYKPDLRYLVEPAPDDPFSAIVTFRDQLSRKGIRLMVLPMPGKPSIYSEKLTRRADAQNGRFESHTRNVIAGLQRAGVETLDLFETFRLLRQRGVASYDEPYYLARDTHWSPAAARIAAEAAARRVRDLGWAQTGLTEYQARLVPIRRSGDIVRMIGGAAIEQQFPAEEVLCHQVVQRTSGELYKDDPHSPVLVLGDSFFRMYEKDQPGSAGFIAHLARELRMPLASIVNDGGASTLVRQELSRRPELLKGKTLVIWEFVERDLRFGTEGWKYVPLPGD